MSGNAPESKSSGLAVAEGAGYQRNDKQDAFPAAATTIPEKYKGTRVDQDDMILLGKKQVLRRNFKFTTILGFASTGVFG
jgi:choline transport protein